MKVRAVSGGTLIAIALLSASAQAAHWVVQSQGDASSPTSYTSGSDVTRGSRSSVEASISGGLYGSGTFKFFGETDNYNKEAYISPDAYSYNGYVEAYYTLTY